MYQKCLELFDRRHCCVAFECENTLPSLIHELYINDDTVPNVYVSRASILCHILFKGTLSQKPAVYFRLMPSLPCNGNSSRERFTVA